MSGNIDADRLYDGSPGCKSGFGEALEGKPEQDTQKHSLDADTYLKLVEVGERACEKSLRTLLSDAAEGLGNRRSVFFQKVELGCWRLGMRNAH
jgi:hypothetical protein